MGRNKESNWNGLNVSDEDTLVQKSFGVSQERKCSPVSGRNVSFFLSTVHSQVLGCQLFISVKLCDETYLSCVSMQSCS